MKNLKKQILKITAFAVTALFLNFTVTAQDWGTQDTTNQDTTSQDTSSNVTESSPQEQNMRIDTTSQEEFRGRTETTPQEQNQRTDEPGSGTFGTMGSESSMDAQDHDQGVNYSEEVQKDELPEEVNSSLQELYPAHEVEEAYRGDDDSYKVKVKNENDEAVVYYNSEGSFERARNLSGLQQEGAFPQQQGQRTEEGINQDNTMNQGTQGTWGTEADTTQQGTQGSGSQWDTQDQQGTEGTQGTDGEWGTQDNQDNEGSAYPQEQNQRSDDWGIGTGTDTESEIEREIEGAQDQYEDTKSDVENEVEGAQDQYEDTKSDIENEVEGARDQFETDTTGIR